MHAASLLHRSYYHPMCTQLARLNIKPRKFNAMQDGTVKTITLSRMVVAPSVLPALARQKHALGLFSQGNKRGDFLAVFMAPIEMDEEYADKLDTAGYGTHLHRMPTNAGNYTMNGAYDSPDTPLPHADAVRWTLFDYSERSAVANIANDSYDLQAKGGREMEPNCRIVYIETIGETLPCVATGEMLSVSHLAFLCATKDIAYGDEVLYSMDYLHRERYIDSMIFHRDVHLIDAYPKRATQHTAPQPQFVAPMGRFPVIVHPDSFWL